MGNRFGFLSQGLEQEREIVVRVGKRRIQLDRFTIGSQGFLGPFAIFHQNTQVEAGRRILRINLAGGSLVRFGLLQLAGIMVKFA